MRALLGLLLLLAATAAAEPIYKSVDRDGRVSYSSEPPADAETTLLFTPTPPPSEAQVREAQQQHEQFEEYNAQRAQERKERAEEAMRQRAAAGLTVVIAPPYIVPVPERLWWGVPILPPAHHLRPPRPDHRPHKPGPLHIGGGTRR
jgi:hypothetical protein